jgi:hypothetical protein
MGTARGLLAVVAALALGAGCATSHGRFDHDAGADFAAYRRFAIVYPEQETSDALPLPTGDLAQSQLVERRVAAAIARELGAKGVTVASAESADLLVAFNVSTRLASRLEPMPGGHAWGWPHGWWHDHWDLAYTRIYTEGLMILDLIDAKSRKLVWRGWTEDPLPASGDPSPVVDHAVREIFENYPPPASR